MKRHGIPADYALSLLLTAPFLSGAAFGAGKNPVTMDQYGGLAGSPCPGKATGHFRLEKVNKRWVFCTPEGNAFWLLSVYAIDPASGGRVYAARIAQKYRAGIAEWAQQAVRRMRQWGFNAIGEVSHTRTFPIGTFGSAVGNSEKMPILYVLNSSLYGMRSGKFKNLNSGVDVTVAPGFYAGLFPDVFDPAFNLFVEENAKDYGENVFGGLGKLASTPWLIGITTDDSDYLTGFGPGPEGATSQGKVHPHLGWIAVVTSPTESTGNINGTAVAYRNNRMYTKYVLRDFLKAKYHTIAALNAAWGSDYTTWDSDGGWPKGKGLLDESGRHSWIGTDFDYLSSANPQVGADLDQFLGCIAERYFSAYKRSIRTNLPKTLMFSPATIQAGSRRQIIEAAGKYADAIQASGVPGGPSWPLLRKLYEYSGGKPVFFWEALTTQTDADLKGQNLNGWGSNYNKENQRLRGQAYAEELNNLFNLRGENGDYFVVGIDWWSWVDSASENMNFGLVSMLDNAYDGREAVIAAGKDSWGYPVGGENRNYGDFLTAVTAANRRVMEALRATLQAKQNGSHK